MSLLTAELRKVWGNRVDVYKRQRMDRSVQSRPSCWVLILRHGASLITLPALGTCLRAGYSVVKVRHVAY